MGREREWVDREGAREIGAVVGIEKRNDGRTEEATGSHGWGGGGDLS